MPDKTFFDLPNSPDQISVLLPEAKTRRLDFSALDYDTALRSQIEYIQTYFPEIFNDFSPNNGVIMFAEILAGIVGKLGLRGDINAQEAFLTLCRSELATSEHLKGIGQKIRRQTAATVDVEVTLQSPLSIDVPVAAGTVLESASGIVYELFRAPNDYTSDIVIPAGKRGTVAFAIEGRFASATFSSLGGSGQTFSVGDSSILDNPIIITVGTGASATVWQATTEPIEKYGANDKVAEVTIVDSGLTLKFGDDINGKALLAGQTITVRYRKGGGTAGRIGTGQIDRQTPVNPSQSFAAILVRFYNPSPSVGGTDKESLEEAKRRGPRELSIRENITTSADYVNAALAYSHPVFGQAVKAVSAISTARNTNLAQIFVLCKGADGSLTAPTEGLRKGLKTYYEALGAPTNTIEVLGGGLKPFDLDMTVVMDRSSDATAVKVRVEKAIDDFFNVDGWRMGQPLYASNVIQAVESVDGVAYVDLFKPGNILALDVDPNGVNFNEVVTLRSRNVAYYYSKTR